MVSLIRLLVASPPGQLSRLAERWGIEPGEGGSLVARLYREMTEGWTLERVVGELSDSARALLNFLAQERKGWASGLETLRALPFTQEDLEALLRELRDSGLVAIAAADSVALGPVEPASPFNRPATRAATVRSDWSSRWAAGIPDDLVAPVRRLRELAAADRPREPLHRLLGTLDQPALEQLAARWHLAGVERSFKRELIRALEARLARREAVVEALAEASELARRLYSALSDAGGQLSPLVAGERLGLDARALRTAYDELHLLFLAHATFVGGRRTLFLPVEVRPATVALPPAAAPELIAVGAPPGVLPPDERLIDDLERLVDRAKRPGARRLWSAVSSYSDGRTQNGSPLTPRAHFLIHACLALGLVDNGTAPAPGPRGDAWRELPREARRTTLFTTLLTEDRWWEAESGNARWSGSPAELRRQVAAALRVAEPCRWYAMSSIARRVRGTLAVEQSQVADGAIALPSGREIAAVVAAGFYWLGVVAVGTNVGGRPISVRVTEVGRQLLGTSQPDDN